MLAALSDRTLAVLTNKPAAATRDILEGLDLARYFRSDRVMGGDGPHPRKPDPRPLMALAAGASAPLEGTLMVGDSVIDWTTARRAGAHACVAAYGFGFEGFPIDQLSTDDRVIRAPLELNAAL
jgi:phosphoglycolate phosphatase